MPKIPDDQKELLKSKVRQILVRMPRITMETLAKELGVERLYATKLRKQVIEESVKYIEEQKINEEVAKLQEETDEVAIELWSIITADTTKDKDKISAIKVLIETKKQLFGAKFDAGMFMKKLGELDVAGKLNDKDTGLILKALRYAGISIAGGNNKESKDEEGAY